VQADYMLANIYDRARCADWRQKVREALDCARELKPSAGQRRRRWICALGVH
jgi:hypothetical protein